MSKKFDIKPPIWPKELTFQEFKHLNPLINENQLIPLYNQYLNKFLTEIAELKIHYKQSLNKQLVIELAKLKNDNSFKTFNFSEEIAAGGGFHYISTGIGSYAVGTYLSSTYQHFPLPVDEGHPRFTVGRPGPGSPGTSYMWPLELDQQDHNPPTG
tara:strand:+ start:156 stop:623 length:468 start_codon:yes stop_codon:yes gene_type:complete